VRNGRSISAAVFAVLMLASACGGGGGLKRNAQGAITKAGDVSVFDMVAGDCMSPPPDIKAQVEKVRAVPCAEKHTQELFAIVDYTKGGAYPGDETLATFADGACLDEYEAYVGVPYTDSSLFYTYLLPSAGSWNSDKDRKVLCILTTTGEQLTTSLKGSKL
jgi:hypothetical protein